MEITNHLYDYRWFFSLAKKEDGLNVAKTLILCASTISFVFFQPLCALADKCDNVMDKANKIYDEARVASKQNEFAEAVNLYKKAETYYRKASKMKKCRCPKIEGSARKYVKMCRVNAAQNRKALEYQERYYEEAYNPTERSNFSCGNKSLVSITHADGTVEEYCE